MEVKIGLSDQSELSCALAEVFEQLGEIKPSLLLVAFDTELEGEALSVALVERFGCPILGGTSCKGALAVAALHQHSQSRLAVMALIDPSGSYGVGHCVIQHESAVQAAQKALDMSLYASGRGYESPALIWCILPPGNEEQILQGFVDVVGTNVPLIGGSSADNNVTGQWQQITDLHCGTNQICVAVFFPDSPMGMFFSSGYQATEVAASVTRAQGRILYELDGEPAANYYNRITGDSIVDKLDGGKVLSNTTLSPFGRKIQSPSGVDEFVLSHPDNVTSDGGLELFSVVKEGETLHLMTTSCEYLIDRAEIVISSAINLLPEGREAKGVLMIYCAGCMLAVENELDHVLDVVRRRYSQLPILGFYTFGEQGFFLDNMSRHGNLMMSAVVFS